MSSLPARSAICTREFQDAVISASRYIKLIHRRPNQTLIFILQLAKLPDRGQMHIGVANSIRWFDIRKMIVCGCLYPYTWYMPRGATLCSALNLKNMLFLNKKLILIKSSRQSTRFFQVYAMMVLAGNLYSENPMQLILSISLFWLIQFLWMLHPAT